MHRNTALYGSLVAMACMVPAVAFGANSGLHHAQSGNLLNHAEQSTRILAAAFDAREFDLDFVNRVVAGLDGALSTSKRHVDRSSALLDEKHQKLEAEFEPLRKDIVRGEGALAKLKADIDSQVKPFMAQGESEVDEREGAPDAVAEPDWDRLKAHIAWLYQDVTAAKKKHAKLTRKLKMPKMRAPKKPKGKRD